MLAAFDILCKWTYPDDDPQDDIEADLSTTS